MRIPALLRRLPLLFLLAGYGFVAQADVIDPFTATQGPFTVGPNEEIAEEDAVVRTSSVLGGFRVAVPVVGDDAEAGSTAMIQIGGGTFTCTLDFPSSSPDNGGGCSAGYDRSEGPSFNLSGSTGLVFDVQAVQGGMILAVTLVDIDQEISIGQVPNLAPGQASIAFSDFFSPTFGGGADLTRIDNIGFAVINQEGQEGSVTLSMLSTDGPITEGPGGPPASGDEIVPQEIPGNYYNPARDGEGCQLTLERDGVTFVLTCYFYNDGEQFWLIGVGLLQNGQIIFPDMTITTGAGYGTDFNADDVIRASWGAIIVTWGDCNNAEFELLPSLAGFEEITLNLTRIIPTTCGGGGAQGDALAWMGAYFGPARDGEGFQLAVEGDGSIFVLTWYTYLDGEQVWLIGTGTRNGNQLTFDNMVITSGADFGSEFNPADVIREAFGTIILNFSNCNDLTAMVRPVLPEFGDIDLDVTKIVPGICP